MRTKFLLTSILVVSCLGIAQADTVETTDGDVINGAIVEENDQEVVIESPTLGRVTVPVANVKPPDAPAPLNPGLFGTGLLEGFRRNLSVGAGGTQSVINDANVNVQLVIDRDTTRHRQAFLTTYYFSSASPAQNTPEVTNANQASVYYNHDLKFESPLFLFGTVGYDFDDFQDWQHRAVANGGVGWDFVESERWLINGRTGPGVSYTTSCRMVPTSCFTRPEWLAGLDFRLNFDEDDYMILTNTYFQDLNTTSNRRYVLGYAWFVGLGYIKGLGMNLGVDFEYDTGRSVKTDLKYYANLAYSF